MFYDILPVEALFYGVYLNGSLNTELTLFHLEAYILWCALAHHGHCIAVCNVKARLKDVGPPQKDHSIAADAQIVLLP